METQVHERKRMFMNVLNSKFMNERQAKLSVHERNSEFMNEMNIHARKFMNDQSLEVETLQPDGVGHWRTPSTIHHPLSTSHSLTGVSRVRRSRPCRRALGWSISRRARRRRASIRAVRSLIWALDNGQTTGYLRHAKIKHARVAITAFLGYDAQPVPWRRQTRTSTPSSRSRTAAWSRTRRAEGQLSSRIPVIGKRQILTFVGMLGSFGKAQGDVPHYTAPGGLPGDDQFKANRQETHSPRRAVRHLRRADGPEEVALPLVRGQQRPAAQLASRIARAHSATSDRL
jgi:hypothetical protein